MPYPRDIRGIIRRFETLLHDPEEVRAGFGRRTAPEDCVVYNPAFDVTPSDLIDGTITERGILAPPYSASIAGLLAHYAFANEDSVALSPYASRFPFEIWILPRRHRSRFEEITTRERRALASLLRETLHGLDTLFGDPPFNWYIHIRNSKNL